MLSGSVIDMVSKAMTELLSENTSVKETFSKLRYLGRSKYLNVWDIDYLPASIQVVS